MSSMVVEDDQEPRDVRGCFRAVTTDELRGLCVISTFWKGQWQ